MINSMEKIPATIKKYILGKPTFTLTLIFIFVFAFHIIKIYYMSQEEDILNYLRFVGLSINNIDQPITWIVSIFSHIHPVHALINIVVFFSVGIVLEKHVKGIEFYAFFIVSALFASAAQIIAFYSQEITMPMVGASGGITAMIGLLVTIRPNMKAYLLFLIPMRIITAMTLLLIGSTIVVIHYGIGAFSMGHTAHISGMVFGLFYGILLYKNTGFIKELITWHSWNPRKKRKYQILTYFDIFNDPEMLFIQISNEYHPLEKIEFNEETFQVYHILSALRNRKPENLPKELQKRGIEVLS